MVEVLWAEEVEDGCAEAEDVFVAGVRQSAGSYFVQMVALGREGALGIQDLGEVDIARD